MKMGTKSYGKSLILQASILEVVKVHGPCCPTSEILAKVHIQKQDLSYHTGLLVQRQLLIREDSGVIATWSITEAGTKWLDMVEDGSEGIHVTIENAAFAYPIRDGGKFPVDK